MLKTKEARAAFVDRRLAGLYPAPPIPLAHKDAYTLLVSVVLSAQCTDKRVNGVTPALFALAGDPAAMARVPVAKIQGIIRPCGLSPQKARAISGLSRLLVERHGGRVPRTFEELEALPGVGHKTASVVMSQAWGEPAFPVDTHIHRLARRWRLSDGRNVARTERDLKAVFPREHWNALHLRMIYYGREHCTARGCDGHTCEICSALNGGAAEKPRGPKRVERVRGGRAAEPAKAASAGGARASKAGGAGRARKN
ncbi:MAG: endonuclease III [Opitutaceae bacterium]|jgi:endonuclease-3|nr:endonuclease III [Opitutaceae bacterium]